jgi:hypothetical protein
VLRIPSGLIPPPSGEVSGSGKVDDRIVIIRGVENVDPSAEISIVFNNIEGDRAGGCPTLPDSIRRAPRGKNHRAVLRFPPAHAPAARD